LAAQAIECIHDLGSPDEHLLWIAPSQRARPAGLARFDDGDSPAGESAAHGHARAGRARAENDEVVLLHVPILARLHDRLSTSQRPQRPRSLATNDTKFTMFFGFFLREAGRRYRDERTDEERDEGWACEGDEPGVGRLQPRQFTICAGRRESHAKLEGESRGRIHALWNRAC